MKIRLKKKLIFIGVAITVLVSILSYVFIGQQPFIRLSIFNKSNPPSKELVIAVLKNVGLNRNNLWLINADGNKEKRITSGGKIKQIFEWSPDNRYISAWIFDEVNGPNGTPWYLGVVEISTGRIYKIHNKETGEFKVKWMSNDRLVDLLDGQNVSRHIPDGTTSRFVYDESIYSEAANKQLSPDNNWFVNQRNEMQVELPVITTTNISSGKSYVIVSQDYGHRFSDWGIGWSGNKLLYSLGKKGAAEIWQTDMEGKNKIKLLDIPLNSTYIEDEANSVEIHLNNPDSFFLFTIRSHSHTKSSRLMKYDFDTKKTTEVNLSEIINDVGVLNNYYSGSDFTINSFSPDRKYITLAAMDYSEEDKGHFVYLINLDNNEIIKLCKDSCSSPIWSK